jgi:hypothetical protein
VRSATRPHAARQHLRRGPARPADAVLNHDVCTCRRGHLACRVVTERYPLVDDEETGSRETRTPALLG